MIRSNVTMLFSLLATVAAAADSTVNLAVDFSKEVAPLRPELHSSGFGPLFCAWGKNNTASADVKSMGFKAARTHDWALVNAAERVVDYFHIFPLMHLDAKDPKNYHFGPTDHLLRRTREETNLEIFYRLGTSIEHSGDTHFNARIPEDLDKTVEIFAGTIRHYNRGWANGFRWGIRYWEIWNEPNGGNMWCYNGPDMTNDVKRNAAFTALYVKCLKNLKAEFPEIKVGGPALWFMDAEYFRMLFDACKKAGVRPDFISWHSYDRRPLKVMKEIDEARALCDSYGWKDCELIINEWHFLGDYDWKGLKSKDPAMIRASWEGPHSQVGIDSSCYTLALLTRFQTSPLAQGYYYGCAHTGRWGFRNDREEKYKVYYGLKLFGDFLKDYRTICASTSDDEGVTALAAKDGTKRGVLVTDYRSGKRQIVLDLGKDAKSCRVWVHDDTRDFAEIPATVKDGKVVLEKASDLSAAFLVRPTDEVLISDVAAAAGKTAWRAIPYETKDGIRGRMLYAPWGLKPRTPVEIPLGVKGRYRIRIGMGATRSRLEDASVELMLRLKRDPAPILMDAHAPTRDAGWWTQPVENEWKTVDLDTDDVLVVENRAGTRGMLYWVRLVPTDERGPKAYPHDIIATNDGYAPAADMDELYAPIMRLADSPVSEIHYCVGNGAYTFAVPSKVAIPTVLEKGAQYEGRYAEKCAATYTWIAKDHPHVLDELADFTHKLGMKFFVSFRTGCTVNHVRRGELAGKVAEDPAGFGICRPEHLCRLWDGTVVPRFSYADKGVQDWFLKFYAEMLTERVDGISLIWMRALPAMLFEDAFRSRFRAAYGDDLKKADDPRVGQLRAEIMTEFHRRVRALAGKRRVTIVTPPDRATCESFGLDLKRLAREGLVDEFVAGNSKQSAIHDECIDYVDYPYFREACAGTQATFRTCFWGYPGHFTKAVAEGARGGMLWDAGVKPWPDWETTRLLGDRDGARAAAWENLYPREGRVHPLKTLDGLDAAVYPWHVAY